MITSDKKFELAAQGLNILKKVSALILRSGYAQKEIGFLLGKSEAWVSQALGYSGQSTFAIGHVPFLKEILGLDLLRALASGSNCFIVENSKASKVKAINFAQILRDFSHLTDATAQAFEDGNVSPNEAARVREGWEKLKSTGERFVVDIERGSHAE